MIKSKTASFRKLLYPDFDANHAIALLGDDLFAEDFKDTPGAREIIDSNLATALQTRIRHQRGDLPLHRLESIVSKLLHKERHSNESSQDLWQTRQLLGQDLQAFLQVALCGNRAYLVDEIDQARLLKDSQAGSGDAPEFPEKAFEVLLDDPGLCRLMARAYDAFTEQSVLKSTSLRDASLSAVFSMQQGSEDVIRTVNLTIFTPHGDTVSQRSLALPFPERDLHSLGLHPALRAGIEQALELRDQVLDERSIEMLVSVFTAAFLSASRIATDAFTRHDPVHPRSVFKARAGNASLPRKQRDRARAALPTLPDIEVIPVSADPARTYSVNEIAERLSRTTLLPPWAPEAALEPTIRVDNNPGTPAQMQQSLHPQVMTSAFPGLGASGRDLEEASSRALDRVEDLMEGQEIGTEGIAMDRVALDLPPSLLFSVQPLLPIYQASLLELDIEDRPRGIAPLRGLADLHLELVKYRQAGQQSFILNGDVAQLLSKTDLSEIPLSDIRLPFDALFLGFEQPVRMPLDDGDHLLEGAYLAGSQGEISITLVFRPVEPRGHPMLDFRNPLRISLRRDADITLEDAILSALEDGGYDLERAGPVEISDDVRQAAEAAGLEVFSVAQTSQTRLAERNEALFGTLVEGVTIVANTIMAMTSGPEGIEVSETYGNVSDRTRDMLLAPSSRSRADGRRAALRENAFPVRLISLSDRLQQDRQAEAMGLRKSPEIAFWRKGHWRRQAYGPKRSLRRWVWIEPVLCNSDGELRYAGSVYEARAEDL
mgnify:CR=1 FL=1